MKSGMIVLIAIFLFGCAVKYAKVPDDIFTLQDEIIAVKARGKTGQIKQNVKISLKRLRKVAGEFKEVYLLHYEPGVVNEVIYRREGDNIVADLVSGDTYLLFAKPEGRLKNTYDVLCKLRVEVGPRHTERICTLILCPPGFMSTEELFRHVPDLGPDQEDLGFGNIPIGDLGPGVCEHCIGISNPGTIILSQSCLPKEIVVEEEEGEGPASQIAFRAYEPDYIGSSTGSWEIFLMNADGSGKTNLTRNPALEWVFDWSPDGEQMVFASNRENQSEIYVDIYVMNADGSGVTNLTADYDYACKGPLWSPDGDHIVVNSTQGIYVLDRDQSRPTGWSMPRRLTDRTDWAPCTPSFTYGFSSDGQTLAIGACDDIYTINVATGSGLTNQTKIQDQQHFGAGGHLSWFGTEIAYHCTRVIGDPWDPNSETRSDLCKMNQDGSNQTPLTTALGFDGYPIWSPDGTKIAFISNRTGDEEIFLMNADGSHQTNVTRNPGEESAPWGVFSWSPDGTKIAFASDREGCNNVYVVDVKDIIQDIEAIGVPTGGAIPIDLDALIDQEISRRTTRLTPLCRHSSGPRWRPR
jgi:TolB protein